MEILGLRPLLIGAVLGIVGLTAFVVGAVLTIVGLLIPPARLTPRAGGARRRVAVVAGDWELGVF